MLDRDFKPPDGEGGAGLTNHNIPKNTHSAQERLHFINKVFCDTAFFEEELWETPQSHFPGLARSVVKKSIPSEDGQVGRYLQQRSRASGPEDRSASLEWIRPLGDDGTWSCRSFFFR